jgi:hypothetical protein
MEAKMACREASGIKKEDRKGHKAFFKVLNVTADWTRDAAASPCVFAHSPYKNTATFAFASRFT